MKRFLIFFVAAALFAAGCSKSSAGEDDPDGSGTHKRPVVTTADVTEHDDVTAVLGGSVADASPASLTAVGVQYVVLQDEHAPAWDAALSLTADVAASWSVRAEGLASGTTYAVRAFVRTASEEYFGQTVTFSTDAVSLLRPVVRTAEVADFDATSALLGGTVTDMAPSALSEAGVQYMLCSDAASVGGADWSKGIDLLTAPDLSWSVRATGLTASTQYAVRAFAGVNGRRYFGQPEVFVTAAAGAEPLTVAELRRKYAAAEDVAALCVRGYVALSIPDDLFSESFDAGWMILCDNTGAPASALALCGSASNELRQGDYVEVSLSGAVRDPYRELIPRYAEVAAGKVRVISRGHAIEPVWATADELAAGAAAYVCSPVRVSRVYAETPGVPFSAADNFFTDGQTRFAVYAKGGSTVGELVQNAATGTLCGICWYDGRVQVVPTTPSDVADFTGEDGIAEGEPAIEILNTEYYEFAPQGGTRVVDCRVTAPAGMRLWADMRNIDESRYSVDIAGSRVRITARANTTGVTADYTNCYLYLAESKDGRRYVPQTLRITQLSNEYESLPALIQANGGEWASVHEAVVNGVQTNAMKIGTGSSTGHYMSDPTGAVGDRTLRFYAVGWKEGDHEAGTLFLRVTGGGEASVASIPLTINDGATGQAPFVLSVGGESRYEVALKGLEAGSVVEFSTSPSFDKRADKRTGRALLFGVQID